MLNSVLLHLERATQAEAVIRLGVAVARPLGARVRGLTLLDTRRVESALASETAVYAAVEQSRQAGAERQQGGVRAVLSQACLAADLNFDVRRRSGDPLQVLPSEARFHDLVVTSAAGDGNACGAAGLQWHDLIALVQRGVEPLLVVQPRQSSLDRVLLVHDASDSSWRAIRSYLGLNILPHADHRLLAIGRSEVQARAALAEVGDYCLARRPVLETGCLVGRPRQVLLPYARKWQSDLLVMGAGRGSGMWRSLTRWLAVGWWRKLNCGLFVTN